jgi:hypothetical protein
MRGTDEGVAQLRSTIVIEGRKRFDGYRQDNLLMADA